MNSFQSIRECVANAATGPKRSCGLDSRKSLHQLRLSVDLTMSFVRALSLIILGCVLCVSILAGRDARGRSQLALPTN